MDVLWVVCTCSGMACYFKSSPHHVLAISCHLAATPASEPVLILMFTSLYAVNDVLMNTLCPPCTSSDGISLLLDVKVGTESCCCFFCFVVSFYRLTLVYIWAWFAWCA